MHWRGEGEGFIGRAVKGFDFLGYRLSPGLTVAKQTLERFAERAARLQERERCFEPLADGTWCYGLPRRQAA